MTGFSVEMRGGASACREAATRAYSALRESGVVDPRAFEAAVTVYRYHHPDTQPHDARYVVAEWLAPDA